MKYTNDYDEFFSHINFLKFSLSNINVHESTDEVTSEHYVIEKFKEELIKEPIETYIKNHQLIFQSLPSSDEILEVRIDFKRYFVPDDDVILDQYFNQNN